MAKSDPKILYKYRSLSGDNFKFTHDIFMKNELYFPHPDQINDPFDCKIPFSLESITREMLIKFVKISNLEPLQIKEVKRYIEDSPMSELIKDLREAPETHRNVGILSFSQKYLDILMWGHYADSHKGICIAFDYNELSSAFRDKQIACGGVNYPPANTCPKWNPFDVDVEAGANIEKVYFTKSIDWEYEEEWRVMFLKHGGTLQKIKPNAIVSVYLGCQIAEGDEETVIKWCSQREQKPKVYKMIKDDTSYSLKEKEVSY